MRDHTFNNTPVAAMPTDKILEVLQDGFEINDDDGMGEVAAARAIRQRLELELQIRAMGLRQ